MNNNESETIDSTNDTDLSVSEDTTLESEDEATVEVAEDSKNDSVDVAKLQETNAKLYARAKRAEEALKTLSKDKKPSEEIKSDSNYLTRDEAVLIAKGYDDALIGQLKKIAKANNVSLSEAEKDDLFVAYKEKIDKEQRAEKARLASSKGSGSQSHKGVSDMSSEEHKDFWKKKMGL